MNTTLFNTASAPETNASDIEPHEQLFRIPTSRAGCVPWTAWELRRYKETQWRWHWTITVTFILLCGYCPYQKPMLLILNLTHSSFGFHQARLIELRRSRKTDHRLSEETWNHKRPRQAVMWRRLLFLLILLSFLRPSGIHWSRWGNSCRSVTILILWTHVILSPLSLINQPFLTCGS